MIDAHQRFYARETSQEIEPTKIQNSRLQRLKTITMEKIWLNLPHANKQDIIVETASNWIRDFTTLKNGLTWPTAPTTRDPRDELRNLKLNTGMR